MAYQRILKLILGLGVLVAASLACSHAPGGRGSIIGPASENDVVALHEIGAGGSCGNAVPNVVVSVVDNGDSTWHFEVTGVPQDDAYCVRYNAGEPSENDLPCNCPWDGSPSQVLICDCG